MVQSARRICTKPSANVRTNALEMPLKLREHRHEKRRPTPFGSVRGLATPSFLTVVNRKPTYVSQACQSSNPLCQNVHFLRPLLLPHPPRPHREIRPASSWSHVTPRETRPVGGEEIQEEMQEVPAMGGESRNFGHNDFALFCCALASGMRANNLYGKNHGLSTRAGTGLRSSVHASMDRLSNAWLFACCTDGRCARTYSGCPGRCGAESTYLLVWAEVQRALQTRGGLTLSCRSTSATTHHRPTVLPRVQLLVLEAWRYV